MSQAYADGSEPPLPEGAKQRAYIDEMANASGLSSSEFVATTTGIISSVTGVIITRNPGVRLINEALGDNLASLSSAADYPDWDTLSENEKSTYVSQENYDATKYVALLDAFDLTDGYERFSNTGSSGGGFVFTDEETNKLNRIGRIGNNWKNRVGQTINSLTDSLTQDYRNKVYKYLYGEGSTSDSEISYDGEKPEGWNDSWYIYYKNTNTGWVEYRSSNNYWKTVSISDTYLIINKTPNSSYGVTNFYWFSKAPFTYAGSMVGSNLDKEFTSFTAAEEYTSESGNTFYRGSIGASLANPIYSSSQSISQFGAGLNYIEEQILFGDSGNSGNGELTPDIIDYPTEELPPNTDVYYPSSGISPSTTWNQYITVQRPENPFNPDDQSSTPEWQQETKQNVQGLQGIHFDKLFPFSMVYSIPNLVNVVRNGVTNDSQAKNVVVVPFRWSDTYVDELRLDLSDLVSLLVMVRPFNRVLLVFALLMALVLFWKSILTGD